MKYALVTGGSRGIGRAVSLELADQGFNILINYLSNQNAALETQQLVEEKGVKAELLKFDVSNREEVRQALTNWYTTHTNDTLEVLVNNSGIRKDNLMIWMQDEEWDSVISTSLGGFYNVTKQVLPEIIKGKSGRIINIVSLSGLKGLPGQTNYSAAKAAVIGATKALAQEVGRRNITVNAVAPGFIRTEMTEGIDEKEYKANIPLRRFGTAEEVAALVGFLASPAASYITGEVISINGGLY
ncbi:3-oxoacyl-ACP reductase [Flammeovirgaceae bacterium 311]|nr:3-oxoacyl-ACP reductase [Flammeovirgaceae bacterium 311]